MERLRKRETVRADAYRLLAACFCLPEVTLLAEEGAHRSLEQALEPLSARAAREAEALDRTFREATEEALQVEYARLFVGPYEVEAPPYGSVYLDEGRTVMGASTQEAARFYREEGLAIASEFRELPDHISAELEFLSFLITQGIGALEAGDAQEFLRLGRQQGRFLGDHLLRWAPSLCRRIEEHTGEPYFLALARCLATFLQDSERDLRFPFDERAESHESPPGP